jgi:UDP-2,3-diacylglucosamine pyrophosphatase LpxH
MDTNTFRPSADNPQSYRSIWISDVHLGTKGCKAAQLLDFLHCHDAEFLYLVGDMVDGWRLKKSWYWDQAHNDVVQKILYKSRQGTKVVYIPGNHDEFLRDYIMLGLRFGEIELTQEAIHTTIDGRNLLIMHGDELDGVVKHIKWLAILGDWAYNIMLSVNHVFNLLRRKLGYPYWSLSAYLKHKVKNAVNFISSFESSIASLARKRNLDGVVCGHIHKAEIRDIDGILYCNDGDWVESCTALVEDWEGKLKIIYWNSTNSPPS